MRVLVPTIIFLTLTACSPGGENGSADTRPDQLEPVSTAAPAGTYRLDKAHASLIFRVNHLGFSNYTARFKHFDAELRFDPHNPESMSVTAVIDPNSIETDFPNPETLDFNAQLRGESWLDSAQFPEITFRSTDIVLSGPDTAKVSGDLALRGVTRPVTLDVTFNGGYRGHPMDPNARIGFSAVGVLERSDFGMEFGLPPEGSQMGVGDQVEVIIEVEFNGPPMPAEGQ